MLPPSIEAIARRQLLERIYDRMTDEEKKTFVMMTMQQRSAEEIADAIAERRHREEMQAIYDQSAQLNELRRRQQNFGESFASNIAGNAAWAGAEWLIRRLSKLK